MPPSPNNGDGDASSRPSFAKAFPRQPKLDALVDAFARGNYAFVRAEAPKVERGAETEDVRRAAREILDRTKADPTAVRLLVLTAVLLVTLATYWAVNGKAPSQIRPAVPAARAP